MVSKDISVNKNTREGRGLAFTSSTVSVASTATLIKAANVDRVELVINNTGGASVYLGGSGVTSSNGLELRGGETIFLDTSTAAVYGITASGSKTVRLVEV